MDIEKVILHAGESVYVDFKKTAYRSEIFLDFLKDMMGMANAPVEEDRYLIVGVKHHVGDSRELVGLGAEDLLDDSVYYDLLHKYVEPPIPFDYTYVTVAEKRFGVFRIYNTHPPYMMRNKFTRGKQTLQIGDSFIRVGTSTARLRRGDIDNIFARRLEQDDFTGKIAVQVILNGRVTSEVSPCPKVPLPSDVARQRITAIIAQKQEQERLPPAGAAAGAAAAGPTGCKARRASVDPALMEKLQEQFKGMDLSAIVSASGRPGCYEDRSIEELEKNLRQVQETYQEEDLYALFEEQAYKLNFRLLNAGDRYIEDCTLTVTLPPEPDIIIATTLPQKPQEPGRYGIPQHILIGRHYPTVEHSAAGYRINATISNLKHGVDNLAFSEPLRVLIPQRAAGQPLRFSLVLTAKNLRQPIQQDVMLTIA